MPTIIDNLETSLIDELDLALSEKSTRLDACVGYFNLRGWKKLLNSIDKITPKEGGPAVRLLVGMSSSSTAAEIEKLLRDNAETLKPAQMSERDENCGKEKELLRKQLTLGIPTLEDKNAISKLGDQLGTGKIQIRFFGEFPLHAKLYLCHRDIPKSEIVGYVGSSNLTMSGLENQGELNVDVLEDDATTKLQKWFDERWDAAEEYDLTADIQEIIKKSWTAKEQPDPYLIYLKLAYHLSREAREGLSAYEIPEEMEKELLDFQSSAVRMTTQYIMARGGAMIGDVVGLGKTLMATAVAKILDEQNGYQTLVICPPKLASMWEDYLYRYKIRGKVMSIGMLENHLEKENNYQLIIVDESHNFRTRGGRRWGALKTYIETRRSKVLLLTATPYNKHMSDIGGQLGLFISDDADLGLRPERAIETAGGKFDFQSNDDINPSSLKAFERSEYIEDWQRLLGNYMIRRTRGFIEDRYAKTDKKNGRKYLQFSNGKERFFLPKRQAKPIPIEMIPSDPTNLMISDKTIETINNLYLPRFGLSGYTTSESMQNATKKEQEIIDNSKGNAKSLRGLTRTLLFKRLSSNPHAFSLSLKRHLVKNLVARQSLETGDLFPTSDYEISIENTDEAEEIESPDQDLEETSLEDSSLSSTKSQSMDEFEVQAKKQRKRLLENPPKGVHLLNPEIFSDSELEEQKKSLLDHLNEDIEKIKNLLAQFGEVTPENDSKLQDLIKILTDEHPDEKIIVFTEYTDTAKYLNDALKSLGISEISLVTGKTNDPLSIVQKFSPKSNDKPDVSKEEQIRILVTTDVLSEGLNLQDARIIINFDLPWAIIKLFQRAGRVDRIKQEAEEVIIYSLLPFKNVEDAINLQQKLQQRLRENAEMVGSDELIFGSPEEISKAQKRFIEKGDAQSSQGLDVDYSSEAYEIWRNADEESQKQAKSLPDNVHSTQDISTTDKNPGVLLYAQTAHSSGNVDRIIFLNKNKEGVEIRGAAPLEALQMAQCEKGESATKQRKDFYELIKSGYEQIQLSNAGIVEGQLSGVRKRVRTKIGNYLDTDQIFDLYPKEKMLEAHTLLGKAHLTDEAEQSLRRAVTRDSEALIDDVFRLLDSGKLTINIDNDPGSVDIMCSMGFAK